ncbi:MAG: hypothetical protein RBR53_02155 [Desulforegulaceae bacterium]|nr:hypothetical protein [Desulforegulaceae bacterium]
MENFQRDLERKRVKKEPGENIKKKWSLLFISSRGKTFNLRYIRALSFVVLFCFVFFLGIAIISLTSFIFLKKDNTYLKESLEKADLQIIELKNENEQLKIKLAFLKPPASLVELKESVEKNKVVKKEEVKVEKIKDFSKIPLEARNFRVKNLNSQVETSFDIVNVSKSDLTLSGYIFVLLNNERLSENHWMVSPYSKISGAKPLNPKSGQYFSIQRFKPVTIKFPGISSTGVLDCADIFVYGEDGELLLKKGFSLNES